MFDYKQDIGLLHGSLSSAAYPNSGNLFDCCNAKDALLTVYDSVKMIVHHSLKGAKNENEKINIQLYCNQKLHAALFFTTLRSHGIKSKAADEFYDSILYNWPSMSLKFYVELNYKCDWSEYFVMCALQLPSETLFNVLQMIFEIPFENDIKYYSWHLILQTLIFKLFEVSYDKEVHYPFDFDFVVESSVSVDKKSPDELTEGNYAATEACDKTNAKLCKMTEKDDETIYKCDNDKSNVSDSGNKIVQEENGDSTQTANRVTELYDEDTEEENDCLTPYSYKISDNEDETTETEKEDLTLFKEMCNNLYDNIASKLEESNEIGVLKILLHAVKKLSKLLIIVLKRDDSVISPFENYISLLKEYLSNDVNQEKLKIELKKCSVAFSRHAHATVSWNVCLNYLIFLLEHYIDEVFHSVCSSESLGDSSSFHKNILSVVHSLNFLNYPCLKSEEHITLLCKIIQFEFEGSSHAATIFLMESAILKEKNVLAILEENFHMINLSQSYPLLTEHIMSTDSPEMKQSLLKILYKCLQMNKLDMYNTVLGHILVNYGLTQEFQLPDCNDQLSNFAYQTPSQEEIEKKIPALLIQNPKSTLKYLIDEALLQGPEGKVFIQFLKHFQNACLYVKSCGPVCILQEILNDYFNKPKLELHVLKNMETLCKFLVQVHSETQILLPCDFFSECLIPKLHPKYDRIGLVLECAFVLVPALLSDDSFLKNSAFFCNLIAKLGNLANYFIVKGDGKMKSFIIPILKDLEIHQQKSKQINEKEKSILWSIFKDFNEMTCVYFEAFLPGDIDLVSRAAVWIRCCKNEDSSTFEAKFSVENLTYTSLVNTLVEVLPHLTKDEWSYCFNLIKLCCTNYRVRDEIMCSNNLFQLCEPELNTYAAVSAVITSLHFILNSNTDELLYLSSCFSNFLKDVVYQKETDDSHLLLSIALEFCHLIASISPDLIHMYQAALLEMKKEIYSRFSESGQSDCTELLNHIITCLPDIYQDENRE